MPETGPRTATPDKRSGPIVGNRVRKPGRRRQTGLASLTLVVIAGLIGAGYYWFVPRTETTRIADYTVATVTTRSLQDTVEIGATVTARHAATVTAPEHGFIARLYVSEGDWVTAGRLIAELDSEALQDSIASLERNLARSLRDLERLVLQHEFALARSERQARTLRTGLQDATASLADVRALAEIGSASATEIREAERRVENAEFAILDHGVDLTETVSLHGITRRNQEDDIVHIRREIASLERRLAATRITAPITGRVVSISAAARSSGESMSQHQVILQIADTRDPVIETNLEEQYVSRIAPGHPVAVEIGGTRLAGVVERIGQFATVPGDGGAPVVELDVAVDLDGGEIIPGSSALVEVLIGQIDGALVLPRGPYLTSGSRRYLYRVDGEAATRVEVEYGTITSSWAEVRSGVSVGDIVITSSYSGYIDQQTVILGGNR